MHAYMIYNRSNMASIEESLQLSEVNEFPPDKNEHNTIDEETDKFDPKLENGTVPHDRLENKSRKSVRSFYSTKLSQSVSSSRAQFNPSLKGRVLSTPSEFSDFPDRNLSPEFRGKWRVSLYGCLGNPKLSFLTCLCPCYTAARNAETVGDHCPTVGLLYFLFWPYGVYIAAETRRRIRERKIIDVEKPVSCNF